MSTVARLGVPVASKVSVSCLSFIARCLLIKASCAVPGLRRSPSSCFHLLQACLWPQMYLCPLAVARLDVPHKVPIMWPVSC